MLRSVSWNQANGLDSRYTRVKGVRVMDTLKITEITHAFRKGFEIQKDQGLLPNRLEDFPSGCCGVASELLGHYLNTQHGLKAEYICGERDGLTHAWLELDGVVIDITGDQFDGRPPVFMAAKDEWYTSWEEASRSFAVHVPTGWNYGELAVLDAVLSTVGLPNSRA